MTDQTHNATPAPALPNPGFADSVHGLERDRHGHVRASELDSSWMPPFEALSREQAAAYVDAEPRNVLRTEGRSAWWTWQLPHFNDATPLQLLDAGRYRELWQHAASMRIDDQS
jgi:hypothetical protein